MNEHLDNIDRGILEATAAARESLAQPLVGDIVTWPDGQIRRISDSTWPTVFQSSTNGGFYINSLGYASFSGALHPPFLRDFVHATNERREAAFWFFHHGEVGPGRAVHVTIPVRVHRLVPFRMTREEAIAHPRACKSLECWADESHPEYLKVLDWLMNPPVLSNPEAS